MAHDILIVDDEADIRMLIAGCPAGRRLRDARGGRQRRGAGGDPGAAADAGDPRHLAAGQRARRHRDPAAAARRDAVGAGCHDQRPRHDRDGGRGDQDRRLRFHRKAVQEPTACCWSSRARSRRRSCGAKMPNCGCAPAASSTWSARRRRSTSCGSRSSGWRRPAAGC